MIRNYITIALRNLRRNLSYTLLNVFGLALSIACGILIFLLVRQHLSYDTWHEKTDRIAMICTESRRDVVDKMPFSPYPMGAALRQEYAFLEKTAMVSRRSNSLITIAENGAAPVKFKEENTRAAAEPELFSIFDFPLAQGDLNGLREPFTALLTEKLARKYYGTTDAVGKTFKLNAEYDFRVVGVLKDIPDNTALQYQMYTSWATMEADSNSRRMLNNWGGIQGGTQCYVLFREGHSQAALESAFATFREKYFHPEVRNWYYHALPLSAIHLDPDYGSGTSTRYLWTLGLIGLFLLLTACVNFVNMATAQALNRAREVGVRKTMGSTRGQLFWQFMSETSLIVLMATVLSLVLARMGIPFLNDLTGLRLTLDFSRDAVLYGFLLFLMLIVVFLAGAYPGVVQSRFQPALTLKGAIDNRQVGGFSLRRMLVGVQFAISQALIIGAIAVTAQMEYARNADLGFRREGIVNLPLPGGDTGKSTALKQQLSQIASVEQISLCMQPPASGSNWNTQVQLEGRTERELRIRFYGCPDRRVLRRRSNSAAISPLVCGHRHFYWMPRPVRSGGLYGRAQNQRDRYPQNAGRHDSRHPLAFRQGIRPADRRRVRRGSAAGMVGHECLAQRLRIQDYAGGKCIYRGIADHARCGDPDRGFSERKGGVGESRPIAPK